MCYVNNTLITILSSIHRVIGCGCSDVCVTGNPVVLDLLHGIIVQVHTHINTSGICSQLYINNTRGPGCEASLNIA